MGSVLFLAAVFTSGCTTPCAEGFGRNTEGNCVPYRRPGEHPTVDTMDTTDTADSGGDTDTPLDTDTGTPLGLDYGDPIEFAGSEATTAPKIYEFVDVVALDEEHAVAVGQGGYALTSLEDGHHVWREETDRFYDVAWDGTTERLYLGTRENDVRVVDLSDRSSPRQLESFRDWNGFHEDLAADDGLLLVAALEDGAVLLDGVNLQRHSVIEAGWVAAVGLSGDRAIVADGAEILLYDVSEPSAPEPLSAASVRATARNITFDGVHVGVALGGHGVAVLRVEGDELLLLEQFDLPGSTYGVALDGSSLWAAAWSEVALIWLGEGGPAMLGTEPVTQISLGLGASGGRAVAADWIATSAFQRIDGVAGPEVSAPGTTWASSEDPPEARVEITNLGAVNLELDFGPAEPSRDLDVESLVLAPGERGQVVVTGRSGELLETSIAFTSNDPDELTGVFDVKTGQQAVGQVHGALELEGYVPPDTNLEPYDLSEQTGRVTVLAYFTLT